MGVELTARTTADMSQADERQLQEFATAFSNDLLHLIILPTEQCNFRCVYCYEDFSVGTMKRPVIEGVKALVSKRIPTLRQLHIAWFGGEPLIALQIVDEIATFTQNLAASNPSLTYSSEMTTNGYRLDLPTISRLCEIGVRQYQISLDGPPELHDKTRVRRNGGGSFEEIWANLLAIRSSSLATEICLRIHVTRANARHMPAFLDKVRETFLSDSRFSVLLKAVGRWGGPNDETLDLLAGDERVRIMEELQMQIAQGVGGDAIYRPGSVCYASRPNSFVIRATGDIGKCTVALADPANSIGHLMDDGTLKISDDIKPWLRGWQRRDNDALGCPLIGIPRKSEGPVLLQIGVRPIQTAR